MNDLPDKWRPRQDLRFRFGIKALRFQLARIQATAVQCVTVAISNFSAPPPPGEGETP